MPLDVGALLVTETWWCRSALAWNL